MPGTHRLPQLLQLLLVVASTSSSLVAANTPLMVWTSDVPAPVPLPTTRSLTGMMEVLGATPAVDLDPDAAKKVPLHAYILQDTELRDVTLSFELFSETPPIRTKDRVTVRVYGEMPLFVVLDVSLIEREEAVTVPGGASGYTASSAQTFDVLFVIQHFSGKNSVCATRSAAESLTFTGTRNIADQFAEMSNGRLTLAENSDRTIHVAGPYTTAGSAADSCYSYVSTWRTAAKDAAVADGYDLNNYGTIAVFHPLPNSCGWGGLASLTTCNKPWFGCYASNWRCESWVTSHELMHNRKLSHSAVDPEDDEVTSNADTYADWSCLMGNYFTWVKHNAVKMVETGFLDTDKVTTVTTPGEYQLTSLDFVTSTAATPQVVLVYDKTAYPNKIYYFSVRTATGYSYAIYSWYKDGVNVHYSLEDDNYSFYVKNMQSVGDVYVLPTRQWTVKVNALPSSSTATLQVIPCVSGGSTCPYQWVTGTYGTCTQSCGGGTRSRTVQCVETSTSNVKDDVYCALEAKPVTQESCNTGACTSNYFWSLGSFGPCSLTCGGGTRTRTVVCKDGNNGDAIVADGNCDGAKPATSEACNTQICPDWYTSGYSSCSVTCGPGTKTRTVECRTDGGSGTSVADSQCATAKPDSQTSCNVQDCTYTWETDPFGSCSVTCGGGTRTRAVRCKSGSMVVADSLCEAFASKPATVEVCNDDACPNHVWVNGTFGACSVTCDTGIQTRTVTCENNGVEVSTGCDPSTKPATQQACNAPLTCDPCKTVDCGVHGSCVATQPTGTCSCTDGYSGSACDIAPSLSNVKLETPNDTDATVFWGSTGNIDKVTILMYKQGSSVPFTIVTNTPNQGSYTFDPTATNLDTSGMYTVRVIYSSTVQADSPAVYVDLCLRKLCLNGGSCTDARCVCPTGFAGDSCQTSVGLCTGIECRNGGTCVEASGQCNCTGTGYTGGACTDLSGCVLSCAHLGFPKTDCSACVCQAPWTGTKCDVCGLSCGANGAAASDCSACQCELGFEGDACDEAYWLFEVGPFGVPLSDGLAEQEQISRVFARDLETYLCIATSRVVVEELIGRDAADQQLYIRFRLLSLPAANYTARSDLTEFPPTCNGSIAQRQIPVSARGTTITQQDIFRWGDVIEAAVRDPSHPLLAGSIFHQLNQGSVSFTSTDPTSVRTDGSSSDSFPSWALYTVIAVALVVLVGGAIMFCIHHKRLEKEKENFHRNTPDVGVRRLPTQRQQNSSQQAFGSSIESLPRLPTQVVFDEVQVEGEASTRPLPPLPPRPPPEPPLPPYWAVYESEQDGYPYYYNAQTGESTWTRPTA